MDKFYIVSIVLTMWLLLHSVNKTEGDIRRVEDKVNVQNQRISQLNDRIKVLMYQHYLLKDTKSP